MAGVAFDSWQAYVERQYTQREKLQDVLAMLESDHASQLLRQALAGWREYVIKFGQAEDAAIMMAVRGAQRQAVPSLCIAPIASPESEDTREIG